ncbi:putative toxin-antitoxin system toxin component, PIN family [Variovorax soli]|uniref:PIN family toxin of toxin-antitoxin system n=1 Tax=Variovorax soli TaxID=376815 RepID=A0ABU1NA17_9BURK|nr:putative toxin-antitoxin system toxin component, PIN family [Variovorax soli]MDR6534911.1 putative PIN family toxin of toxin-antitoxin system [Variovorax soli]
MRIVIDTNIALDLLVFDDPGCAALLAALDLGELQWIATAAMREELARVLRYPLVAARLARNGRDVALVLAAFDRRVLPVDEAPARAPCLCRDPDDQVFVDLAVAQRARLLSKDRALLEMRGPLARLGVEVAVPGG